MTSKISRCNICGEFFDSKRELKDHKDRKHRIAASKTKTLRTKLAALSSPEKKSTPLSDNNEAELKEGTIPSDESDLEPDGK
jgi:hypothetical protein